MTCDSVGLCSHRPPELVLNGWGPMAADTEKGKVLHGRHQSEGNVGRPYESGSRHLIAAILPVCM